MTRKKLMTAVKHCLDENDLPANEEAAKVAVQCTLQYLQDYVTGLSEELMTSGLYSEARTAGVMSLKIRALMGKE